jgi:hypothetical protein
MNTKNLSIIAAVIGSACAAFTAYVLCHILSNSEAIGYAAAAGNAAPISRVFWWSFSATILFWGLACFGFFWHKKSLTKK